MVLSLFLFTTKLTPDKILEAMHSIDTNTLNNWVKSVFGQSIMAKRKEAFSKEVEGAQFSYTNFGKSHYRWLFNLLQTKPFSCP